MEKFKKWRKMEGNKMAFKPKYETKLKPDCLDFKPFLFDKKHCKLTSKCANAGGKYKLDSFYKYPDLCTGISSIRYTKYLREKYKP